jgi:YgiT-type zinc finger domain-containing protein
MSDRWLLASFVILSLPKDLSLCEGLNAMPCEFCNGQPTKKKVTKHHWLDGRLYVVENVQAEVCTECGERYFHASTLEVVSLR